MASLPGASHLLLLNRVDPTDPANGRTAGCLASGARAQGELNVTLGTTLVFKAISAGPILDQSFDPVLPSFSITIGTFGIVPPPNNLDGAQTFTVGVTGLLTSVDLMVGRDSGSTTEDLLLDIRTTSGGVPTDPNFGSNILGVLNVLKITKVLRVTRMLRLLRTVKIFKNKSEDKNNILFRWLDQFFC